MKIIEDLRCPACGAYVRIGATDCVRCGYAFSGKLLTEVIDRTEKIHIRISYRKFILDMYMNILIVIGLVLFCGYYILSFMNIDFFLFPIIVICYSVVCVIFLIEHRNRYAKSELNLLIGTIFICVVFVVHFMHPILSLHSIFFVCVLSVVSALFIIFSTYNKYQIFVVFGMIPMCIGLTNIYFDLPDITDFWMFQKPILATIGGTIFMVMIVLCYHHTTLSGRTLGCFGMFTVGFVTFTISIIDINDIPNILVTLKFVSLFLMITSAVYFIGSEIYILRMKNISRDIENFLSDNDVDRALASNPCSEFSVYVSGKILKKIGIHTEILRDVSPKKRKSKFYDAWTKKGGLALADKNYPEAIKCLKRAIYIDSMYLDAWLKLFDTHIKLRKVDDAEKCRVNILKIISRILERFIERDNTPVAYHLILLDYARLFARALNKKILSISK